jgi:hypothetical protein
VPSISQFASELRGRVTPSNSGLSARSFVVLLDVPCTLEMPMCQCTLWLSVNCYSLRPKINAIL